MNSISALTIIVGFLALNNVVLFFLVSHCASEAKLRRAEKEWNSELCQLALDVGLLRILVNSVERELMDLQHKVLEGTENG